MLSGVLMVGLLYFYLKALVEDDASVVMTLLVSAPFFSLIFSLLILGEWPTNIQLLGGAFMIAGSLSVSYQPLTHRFKWRLILYAVIACIIIGLMHSLFKFSTVPNLIWDSLFWRSLAMMCTGLFLYLLIPSYKRDFHIFINEHFKAGITLNTTNETLTLIGDSIFAFAILFAPLALVQTTEAYQPIFILIIVFVLSQVGVRYVEESYQRHQIFLKIVGIICVLIGSIILSI